VLSSYLGRTTRRYVSLEIVTQPAVEPVSLAEIKAQARTTHDAEDELLVGYIQAAREYVENRRGLCLIDTQLRVVLDAYQGGGDIRLPRSPCSPTQDRQSVVVEYSTSDTEWQAIDASRYVVHRSAMPSVVRRTSAGWPTAAVPEAAYRITWWAGFGATGSAVPRRYRNSILALAAHLHLNREAVGTAAFAKVPFMVDELLGRRSVEGYA
jgi:uncharacterized phiE125 gp8 family phage protein